MNEILLRFQQLGIIPVVKIDSAKDAVSLAKALCDGGLPAAEITFRTDAAEQAIRNMVDACPDMLVGAGTVLTIEQVDKAIAAGAQFIVSPGLNPKIIKYCQFKNITIIPGTSSPTDIEQAIELGLDVVKFFPAEASGGLAKIKAMSAPYGNILFMPTGGIQIKNIISYLDFSKVIACGGSWMVSEELIHSGEFSKIKMLTREAADTVLGFELKQIGIPACDEKNNTVNSNILQQYIKTVEPSYCGSRGQIIIQTNYLDRAVAFVKREGMSIDEDLLPYHSGKTKEVYLREKIGGLVVHLVQKEKKNKVTE